MRRVFCMLVAVCISGIATAQTYEVGDTITAGDAWLYSTVPDTLVTAAEVILLDATGEGASIIEGVTDGSAEIWLYETTTARVVTRVIGPQYLWDYAGPRSLVPGGFRIKAIEAVDVIGNLTLHARER